MTVLGMMRNGLAAAGLLTATFVCGGVTPGHAADLAVIVATPAPDLTPVRRYLTSYVKTYPFGSLREDYTPLGAPGVSKRAYYGIPRHLATLHTNPRRQRLFAEGYVERTVNHPRYGEPGVVITTRY